MAKRRPRGIDISRWQVDFPVNAVPGVCFVWIRLGYSDTEDPRAGQHITEARKRDIPFGVYWFLYNTHPGAEQAGAAVAHMRAHGLLGHKLVFDAEGDVMPEVVHSAIAEAKRILPKERGLAAHRRVGIYSGGWVKDHGGGTFGADFGWLADWSGFVRPHGWSTGFTRFWQYADHTKNGPLDLDLWMGRRRTCKRVRRFFAPLRLR